MFVPLIFRSFIFFIVVPEESLSVSALACEFCRLDFLPFVSFYVCDLVFVVSFLLKAKE